MKEKFEIEGKAEPMSEEDRALLKKEFKKYKKIIQLEQTFKKEFEKGGFYVENEVNEYGREGDEEKRDDTGSNGAESSSKTEAQRELNDNW